MVFEPVAEELGEHLDFVVFTLLVDDLFRRRVRSVGLDPQNGAVRCAADFKPHDCPFSMAGMARMTL